MPKKRVGKTGKNSRDIKPRKFETYDNEVHGIPDCDELEQVPDEAAPPKAARKQAGQHQRSPKRPKPKPGNKRVTTSAKPRAGKSGSQQPADTGGSAADQQQPATTRRVERRRLADLKPFPLQSRYFHDLSDPELQSLADDIRRNGLREMIEVLPKNTAGYPEDTIISGHQRKRAELMNGIEEEDVVVRYDLAGADKTTIIREFLEHNANRRQMHPLEKARVALGIFEAERGRAEGGLYSFQKEKARDWIGKLLNMSGKSLERYWKLLEAAVEIQDAVRRKKPNNLRLTDAVRVANLPKDDQEKIARRIREGERPKVVVAQYLPKSDGRHVKLADAVSTFIRQLGRGLDDLQGRMDQIRPVKAPSDMKTLTEAQDVIRRLLEAAKTKIPPPTGEEDALLAQFRKRSRHR